MGKRPMGQRTLYTVILLGLCLGGLVAHLFPGDAGHLDAWYSAPHAIEHGESSDHAEPHDHEDHLTLLAPASSSASSTLVTQTTASHSPNSRAVSPLLPPPKAG
jgi:hypothetical protein